MKSFYSEAEKYVKSVRRAIKSDYGDVPGEWDAQLQQLTDMYATYLSCSEHLRNLDDPITFINDGKTACASPYFNMMVSTAKMMDSIIKSFGLSPVSRKKLTGINPSAPEEDFMNEL
jgi:P27 family predicted phage terminase small subunit